MNKPNLVYPYKGILLSPKRNDILIHATIGMNLENITLSERRQTQKDKYFNN